MPRDIPDLIRTNRAQVPQSKRILRAHNRRVGLARADGIRIGQNQILNEQARLAKGQRSQFRALRGAKLKAIKARGLRRTRRQLLGSSAAGLLAGSALATWLHNRKRSQNQVQKYLKVVKPGIRQQKKQAQQQVQKFQLAQTQYARFKLPFGTRKKLVKIGRNVTNIQNRMSDRPGGYTPGIEIHKPTKTTRRIISRIAGSKRTGKRADIVDMGSLRSSYNPLADRVQTTNNPFIAAHEAAHTRQQRKLGIAGNVVSNAGVQIARTANTLGVVNALAPGNPEKKKRRAKILAGASLVGGSPRLATETHANIVARRFTRRNRGKHWRNQRNIATGISQGSYVAGLAGAPLAIAGAAHATANRSERKKKKQPQQVEKYFWPFSRKRTATRTNQTANPLENVKVEKAAQRIAEDLTVAAANALPTSIPSSTVAEILSGSGGSYLASHLDTLPTEWKPAGTKLAALAKRRWDGFRQRHPDWQDVLEDDGIYDMLLRNLGIAGYTKKYRLNYARPENLEGWPARYIAAIRTLSRKWKEDPVVATTLGYLNRLNNELISLRRAECWIPQPQFNGYYPGIKNPPFELIKTAIRKNTSEAVAAKAWQQIAERTAEPFTPSTSDPGATMNPLQKRRFLEHAMIALPETKGRTPGWLGHAVPGDGTLGERRSGSIIQGLRNNISPAEWDSRGFSMMRFNKQGLPIRYQQSNSRVSERPNLRTPSKHAVRYEKEKLTKEERLRKARMKGRIVGALAGMPAFPLGPIAGAYIGDSIAEKRFRKNNPELYARPNLKQINRGLLKAKKIARSPLGMATLGVAGTAAALGGGYLGRKRGESAKPLKGSEKVFGQMIPGFNHGFAQTRQEMIFDRLDRTLKKQTSTLNKIERTTKKNQQNYAIGNNLRQLGRWWHSQPLGNKLAIGATAAGTAAAVFPVANEIGHRVQKNRTKRFVRTLPIKEQKRLEHLSAAQRELALDRLRRMKKAGELEFASQDEVLAYQEGFLSNLREGWRRFKSAFKDEALPAVARGATLGGLQALSQNMQLPPMSVDNISVQRPTVSGQLRHFTNWQLHQLVNGLNAQADRLPLHSEQRKALQRQVSQIETELVARNLI